MAFRASGATRSGITRFDGTGICGRSRPAWSVWASWVGYYPSVSDRYLERICQEASMDMVRHADHRVGVVLSVLHVPGSELCQRIRCDSVALLFQMVLDLLRDAGSPDLACQFLFSEAE